MNSMQKFLATAALSAVAVLVGCEQGKVPVAPEAAAAAKANTADALASAQPKAVGALAENWTKLQGAKGEETRKLVEQRVKLIEELNATNSPNIRKVLKDKEAKARIDYFREKFNAEKRANPEANWFSEQTAEFGKNGERINDAGGGSFWVSWGSYVSCETLQEYSNMWDEIGISWGSWSQASQNLYLISVATHLYKNNSWMAGQGYVGYNESYKAVDVSSIDTVPQGQTAYQVNGSHTFYAPSVIIYYPSSQANQSYNNVPVNPR